MGTPGERAELIRAFNELYYQGPDGIPLYRRVSFLGVETLKCPMDLWIYQEILARTRPEVIVECGVHRGGTTLYLASLCDLLGTGRVIACDIDLTPVHHKVRGHPRIELIEGDSVDPAIHAAIARDCRGRRTMVILDSDHFVAHVSRELRLYGPLVAPGCYLVCEDTNVNGHPVRPDFGPGPHEAVRAFLAETEGWQVDAECERFLVTFNPSGFLLRMGEKSRSDPEPASRVVSVPDRVRASVIIPCYGQVEYTRLCIDALMRHTRPPWELIVIDNGSTDGTAAYFAGLRAEARIPVEIITNPENRGFPAACNQGLKAARGDYLVLLNNDAVVTDGWLDQLIALAESDPKVGMIGPMSNYASPPQLVEYVPYADLEAMHRFAARWRSEHRGRWLTAGKLSGFCLLIKRRVLEAVDGLDERFGLGFFDDDDLALRVRQAGFTLAVAHDLFVHHFGSRTFVGAGIDAETLLDENQKRFAAKWGLAESGGRRVALRPWTPPPREARRPRVSLTMIVRDEEANLPACLESARGLFDEIVVVDTGSTDRTVEIARSFGARVFDFVWVDDFAAARNAALARATGDYAFWLDADDVLDPPQRERLEALLGGLSLNDEAAYVVRCACDPDRDGGGGETVVDHIRLFPLRGDVRWTYRVHEQILPALRQADVPVRWSDVTVRHTGYSDPPLRRRKLERDGKILAEELAERPDDPFVLFNLGSIAIERQDWRAALGYLERSLAGSAATDSITHKLYALIAKTHQMLGAPEAALRACSAGLALNPDDAELLFREAVVRRNGGDRAGAEACWRRILTVRRPERFSSVDAGIYGHLTRRNLAVLAEERGDRAEAATLWAEVLAECPGDREALAARHRLAGPIDPALGPLADPRFAPHPGPGAGPGGLRPLRPAGRGLGPCPGGPRGRRAGGPARGQHPRPAGRGKRHRRACLGRRPGRPARDRRAPLHLPRVRRGRGRRPLGADRPAPHRYRPAYRGTDPALVRPLRGEVPGDRPARHAPSRLRGGSGGAGVRRLGRLEGVRILGQPFGLDGVDAARRTLSRGGGALMGLKRLLFASCHGYVDPSNGASTATRDLLELLAAHGVDCRVLSTGVLDFGQETPLGPILAELGVPVQTAGAALTAGRTAEVYDLELGGVHVTLLPTASSRLERSPDRAESAAFLDLAAQVLERFRPHVLLTYGGHPANLALMAQARRRGVAVVFYLHNFAYNSRSAFVDTVGVLVPTEFCRRFYAAADRPGMYDDPVPVLPAAGGGPRPRAALPDVRQPGAGQGGDGLRADRRRAGPAAARHPAAGGRRPREGRGNGQRGPGPLGALEPAPDGQHDRSPRLLPGEPRGPDAVAVAGERRPGGAGGDGQRTAGAGERPGRTARDTGGGGVRLHGAGAMHADEWGGADGARGGAVGGDGRAALGRPGVGGRAASPGAGGRPALGPGSAGGPIPRILRSGGREAGLKRDSPAVSTDDPRGNKSSPPHFLFFVNNM